MANASQPELKVLLADIHLFIEHSDGITEDDALAALDAIGRKEREEGETAMPSIGTIERLIREAARDRRIAEAKETKRLGDGRRPGESDLDFWKRQCAEEGQTGPDEAMQERIAALNLKLKMSLRGR